MNVRDLPPKLLKELAEDGEKAFTDWMWVTNGKVFGSNKPVPLKKVYEHAFSRGIGAILKRIDEIQR